MFSPAMALMTVATMVAMMLPSVAPILWRYHRHLRAMRASRAVRRTMLFAAGYASVWTAIGLALVALPASRLASWVVGAVVLSAGALQLSSWKSKQLHRCRDACVPVWEVPGNAGTTWREGGRLGIHCVLSCAAPIAVLVVVGLMEPRMMAVITAAITAERVAPAGARIARLTGALALLAGFVMCVRAIEVTMS